MSGLDTIRQRLHKLIADFLLVMIYGKERQKFRYCSDSNEYVFYPHWSEGTTKAAKTQTEADTEDKVSA